MRGTRFYNFSTENTICHSLKMFGFSVWSFYYNNGFGWFRLFNKGLKWKDISIHGLLYSERNGHAHNKSIQLGKFRIAVLD
jgi:hypothetical protein